MTLKDKPFPTGVRGLQREMAARYVGISATKFDEMVDDGRMPKPKRSRASPARFNPRGLPVFG